MGPPKQPPTRIYKIAAKEVMTKIPGQHTWLAIWPQLNPCKGKHRKTVETGTTAAIRSQRRTDISQQKPRSQRKPIYHSDRETASEAATALPSRRRCDTHRSGQFDRNGNCNGFGSCPPRNPIAYCKFEAGS